MEVAAQLRRPGHAFQQLIGDRGGFDRGNADAVEAGHGLQPADHVRQRESLAPVLADVDAGHNHFAVPARHEALGFPEDVVRAAAAFVPAGERDDAEGAHEVAAVLHLKFARVSWYSPIPSIVKSSRLTVRVWRISGAEGRSSEVR